MFSVVVSFAGTSKISVVLTRINAFFRVGFQAYVSFIWKDDNILFNSRCFVSCKLLLWKLDNIPGWLSDYFCCFAIVWFAFLVEITSSQLKHNLLRFLSNQKRSCIVQKWLRFAVMSLTNQTPSENASQTRRFSLAKMRGDSFPGFCEMIKTYDMIWI